MQLNKFVEAFEETQVKVVAISYDPHIQNQKFTDEYKLDFPVLSDQEAATVKEFGILNEEYEPGHGAYGIPHPGIIFVDREGTIQFKRAVPSYRARPNFLELLDAVRSHTAT